MKPNKSIPLFLSSDSTKAEDIALALYEGKEVGIRPQDWHASSLLYRQVYRECEKLERFYKKKISIKTTKRFLGEVEFLILKHNLTKVVIHDKLKGVG